MLVLSKTFETDTWDQAMDCAEKGLFLHLVALALRVKEPGSARETLSLDSGSGFENQNAVVESEQVRWIDV